MGVDVRTMGRSVTSLESRVAELERNGTGAEGGESELDPNVYVTTSAFNDIQGQVNSIGARVSGIESLNLGGRTTTLESEVRTIKADVATLNANTGSSSSSGT